MTVALAASLAVNHAANLVANLAVEQIAASTVTRAQHALVRQCEKSLQKNSCASTMIVWRL
jgi:hypothetical protein